MNAKLNVVLLALLALAWPNQSRAQSGVPLWTNRYITGQFIGGHAIAVDGAGNVFVAGTSYGDLPICQCGGYRNATIKYSNAGVPLWTNFSSDMVLGSSGPNQIAIALDSSGKVFVAGYSILGGYHFETVAYSNSGVPLWTNSDVGSGSSVAYSAAVDSGGNVVVTGHTTDSYGDYATVKYSASGVPLWTNLYHRNGDTNNNFANAVAIDGSDNVFVTGNAATIKYSSAGLPLWTNAGSSSLFTGAIAVDKSGKVFVPLGTSLVAYSNAGAPLWTNIFGSFYGITVDGNSNVIATGGASANGYLTIKYSNNGMPLWTNRYNGTGSNTNSTAFRIAVDRANNVFITGWSGNCVFHDLVTVAYSDAGLPLWTNRSSGAGSSDPLARDIAVDSSGNVFVTGYTTNVHGGGTDWVTIKYASSIPPAHLDFQRLNSKLVLSWTNAGFSLQTAPDSSATFTNLPGATSPYTNPATAPQQFFRLKLN